MPERNLQAMADENRVVLIQITLLLHICRPVSLVFSFLYKVSCGPNHNFGSCKANPHKEQTSRISYYRHFESWGKRSRLPYSKREGQRGEKEDSESRHNTFVDCFQLPKIIILLSKSNLKWILRLSLFSVSLVTREDQLLDHWWRTRHFVFGESLEMSDPNPANLCWLLELKWFRQMALILTRWRPPSKILGVFSWISIQMTESVSTQPA